MANNTTSPAFIKWLQTTDGFLVRIISPVIISVILLAILVLFGSYRRRSRSSVLRCFLWTAYTLSGFLVSYTLGLMESANLRNEQFMVWAVFLLIILGISSNSISGYTIDDSTQWTTKMAQQLLQFVGVALLANSYRQKYTFVLPLYILWFLCLMRLLDRAYAFGFAGQFDELLKMTSDFIVSELELYGGGGIDFESVDADPISMMGYSYLLVEGEEEIRDILLVGDAFSIENDVTVIKDKVTTVESIWQCNGMLLKQDGLDPGGQLKDLCLSFALFKQLKQRLAHFVPLQTHHEETRKLITDGLLTDCDRAFRVIEIELAFLYDFIYNKYSYTFIGASPLPALILSMATIGVSLWVAVVLLVNYQHSRNDDQIHLVVLVNYGGISIDLIVSFLLVFTILCLEIWQIVAFALSDWVKVRLLCKYVRTPLWQGNLYLEKILGTLCSKRVLRPWSNTIGQYSLLESYDYEGWFPGLRKLINKCQPIYEWEIPKGRKDKRPIKLEKEVKMAVVQAMRNLIEPSGRIVLWTEGEMSLAINGVLDQLLWAFQNPLQLVYTWHIATNLCDIAFQRMNYPMEELPRVTRSNRIVANSLSGYCAYLQVFMPQLLPPHRPYLSNAIFNKLLQETSSALGQCKTTAEIYDKLMVPETLTEAPILQVGAKLGKQLIEEIEDESRRWKILADVWAEILVYLSPSKSARGHAERLAEGGEFITHVWALVSHAGIVGHITWEMMSV